MEERKNKNFLIITLLITFVFMTICFISTTDALISNKKHNISRTWNVLISDARIYKDYGNNKLNRIYTDNLNASFDIKLNKPGAYSIYEITVKNYGTINAVLDDLKINVSKNNNLIKYEILNKSNKEKDILKPNDKHKFYIKVSFIDTYKIYSQHKNIKILLNYTQSVN